MSEAHVKSMIDKAEKTYDAGDALKFSQAALNAAHAIQVLSGLGLWRPEKAK